MSHVQRSIHIALPSTGEEEWLSCREPLVSGWLTQGPQVLAFEKAFSIRHQVKHALATTSCTTGLHLILASLGIGPGDEVILPAFTWVATANVIIYCGAKPVFADVDRLTNNISPDEVARRLTKRTKAVIVVHLFGLCADVDAIRAILPKRVKLIEDAACAAGASYKGKPAGTLGDAAAFSFHPRKSITTGEGGMVTTNDDELAELANKLRNHGAEISEEERHNGSRPYLLPDFNVLGFNYRMTDLQGAIGLVQLGKLDRFIEERQRWAEYYRNEIADIPWLRTPVFSENYKHAWQAFVTYVDPVIAPMPRNAIMEYLQKCGISTRPGTHAIHKLGYYSQRFNLKPTDFPGARDCDEQTMAIPLHNRMTLDDFQFITRKLKGIPF